MSGRRFSMRAWLELLRVPNLLTVPGDPTAGFLLAAASKATVQPALVAGVLASLCFYAAGLLLNDWHDIEHDRVERPERPLPSGRVRRGAALAAALSVMALGLGLCAAVGGRTLLIGAILAACVAAYDLILKEVPVAGPVAMGLCRGLSLLLGASCYANWDPAARPVLLAALLITGYIAILTELARHETTLAHRRWIGWLISGLLVLQAACAFVSKAGRLGLWTGIVLLALWPITRWLSRRFAMS